MVEKKDYGYGIIAIVAIVAIVAIIVLFMSKGATTKIATQPELQQAMATEDYETLCEQGYLIQEFDEQGNIIDEWCEDEQGNIVGEARRIRRTRRMPRINRTRVGCYDSDGLNFRISGVCRDRFGIHRDSCSSRNVVEDWYCAGGSDGNCALIGVSCSYYYNSSGCYRGACV